MDEDARAAGVTASVAAAADRFLPDDVPFVVDAGAGTAGLRAGAFAAANFGAGTATVADAAVAAATAAAAASWIDIAAEVAAEAFAPLGRLTLAAWRFSSIRFF